MCCRIGEYISLELFCIIFLNHFCTLCQAFLKKICFVPLFLLSCFSTNYKKKKSSSVSVPVLFPLIIYYTTFQNIFFFFPVLFLSFFLSFFLFFFLSFILSVCLSFFLSVLLSFFLFSFFLSSPFFISLKREEEEEKKIGSGLFKFYFSVFIHKNN